MSVEMPGLNCDLIFKNKDSKRRNHKYEKKEEMEQK